MKKIALVAGILLVLSGSAMAANSLNSGSKGISIGFGDSILNHVASPTDPLPQNPPVDISGRLFVARDMAITAGLGFQINSGDVKGTYFSFNVGGRKYLKTDDFAPFVGVQFSYLTYDAKLKGAGDAFYGDASLWDLSVMAGAEYFLGKQFSIEGSIGAGIGMSTTKIAGTSYDSTYLGTRNFGIRGNFYF
jgi:opacity protein-like surface antigen